MQTPDPLRIVAVHRTVDENGLPTDQHIHGTGTLPTDVKLVKLEDAEKAIAWWKRRSEKTQDTLDGHRVATTQQQVTLTSNIDRAVEQAVLAERKRCADLALMSSSGDVMAMNNLAARIQRGPSA